MYYAIIGDIIGSKSLNDRNIVQKKLEKYLVILNDKYSKVIKKDLSVTLGDEFQGLFISHTSIFEILQKIEAEMFPTRVRFGIGMGELSFDHGSINSPYGSDGEVWWNARKAIENVKKNNLKNKMGYFSNINIYTNTPSKNDYINKVLNLCYAIKLDWTTKQRELIFYTINTYGLKSDFSISEVAKKFKQSSSTIYEKYKAAKYLDYIETLGILDKAIDLNIVSKVERGNSDE